MSSATPAQPLPRRLLHLELFVLLLSIYSIVALCVELMMPLEPEVRVLLERIDLMVCLVFIADFVVHLWRAPDRLGYLKWGWIDLLSAIPAVDWLRWGRVFRILRIVRALRSFHVVSEHFAIAPARGTFGVVALFTVLVAIMSAIAMLQAESGQPGANITTAGDALWWAFVTLTTIGYGDHYPVTGQGRLIAVALVICGLSVFGTFTALVASFFVGRLQRRNAVGIEDVLAEVRELRREVAELRGQDAAAGPGPRTGGGGERR